MTSENKEMVRLLMRNGALLTQECLRKACVDIRDVEMVHTLLSEGNSFSDEFLCALLLVIINTEGSKWCLNTTLEEKTTHEIGRVIIKQISDAEAYATIASTKTSEFLNEYGDVVHGNFTKTDYRDLKQYGFLCYTLIKGKYSIAHMLFEAGCRYKFCKIIESSQALLIANSHPYLQQWLKPALKNASCYEELGNGQFCYDASRLDEIEAYDVTVHGCNHMLFDEIYPQREDAKAASARSILFYSDA